jgi:ubiquinone/menaquinone biosynthesis C-methylase UbiE
VLNRSVTNVIRFFMDECLPAVIRDNRWFMYPFFYFAYRGRNIGEVMDFKRRVYSFTPKEYDRFYNDLNTISRNRETDLNRESLEFILRHIEPSARTLIDVGSGTGFLLQQIRTTHPDIRLIGFDIKDGDANRDAYTYVKGHIERLPFADRSFDVVTCCHTVEHLVNLDQCIAELVRIARKQIFIVTPKQRYFYYTLDEHVNFFPFKEALTSIIPLEHYTCEKVRGDWVYLGRR